MYLAAQASPSGSNSVPSGSTSATALPSGSTMLVSVILQLGLFLLSARPKPQIAANLAAILASRSMLDYSLEPRNRLHMMKHLRLWDTFEHIGPGLTATPILEPLPHKAKPSKPCRIGHITLIQERRERITGFRDLPLKATGARRLHKTAPGAKPSISRQQFSFWLGARPL